MLSLIGGLLGIVPAITRIGEEIAKAQVEKAKALTDQERIKADERIKTLEMQRDILVAEQANASTRWVRPAFAFPFVIYIWKLILWDKVFGWGTTDALSDNLTEIMMIVIGAYFLTRPFEKVGQVWAARKKSDDHR